MRMNKRATELGLTKSTFGNPWGKAGPDQKVTPREMTRLAAYVIKTYPDYYRYFSEKEFLWNKIKQPNRNPLLTMNIGVDELKTGNIDEKSGFSIVASAVEEGRRLILAAYGARTAKERAEERASCCSGVSATSRRRLFSTQAKRSVRRKSMVARKAAWRLSPNRK